MLSRENLDDNLVILSENIFIPEVPDLVFGWFGVKVLP